MKRTLLLFLFALTTCWWSTSVFAQLGAMPSGHDCHKEHQHRGRFFVGGALSYWNDTQEKTKSFDFAPEMGYLFNESWGAGVLLGYEHEQKTEGAAQVSANAFKIAPFVRYYYLHQGPFNLYADAGMGFNFSSEKMGTRTTQAKGFELGLRPGACVDLTEGLCLCLRMGFIGYRDNFFMGEEPGLGSRGFGLRFAPEELMIGLELEF